MWLLAVLALLPGCSSLNILLFLLGTNQFERHTFEFLAQQLALRHHNVITVKPILIPEEPRLVKPKLHLVREKTLKNMLSKKQYEELEKAGDVIPWTTNYEEEAYDEIYWTAHNASCYKMINSNLLDTLQKDALDVAIVYSGNPCQLALAHVLAVPVIYYDLEGLSDETVVASNSPLDLDIPPSKCFLPEINFLHSLSRIRNGICYLKEYLVQSGIPPISRLISKRYSQLDDSISTMFAEDYNFKKRFKEFPLTTSLLRSSSFFFANTDPLLEFPRALSPRVIPVGGLHIDVPKPLFAVRSITALAISIFTCGAAWLALFSLPFVVTCRPGILTLPIGKWLVYCKPWNTSIASAEEGLIVVSLGTQVNQAEMKESQAKAILGALSRLSKYRIYWRIGHKVELKGVNEGDVPKHINLTAFIPQNDLLAHKSCRLLITNGGMSSLMEAVAYGVPVVGIPLYGSNRHNLRKVVNKGLGLVVNKQELTEQKLYSAIKSVLQGTKYSTVAKQMSKEFRSRPTTPFATALHFIEHVGRHHGSAFLGQEPHHPLATLNLDLFIVLAVVLYIVQFLFFRILGLLFCTRRSSAPKAVETAKSRKAKKND